MKEKKKEKGEVPPFPLSLTKEGSGREEALQNSPSISQKENEQKFLLLSYYERKREKKGKEKEKRKRNEKIQKITCFFGKIMI